MTFRVTFDSPRAYIRTYNFDNWLPDEARPTSDFTDFDGPRLSTTLCDCFVSWSLAFYLEKLEKRLCLILSPEDVTRRPQKNHLQAQHHKLILHRQVTCLCAAFAIICDIWKFDSLSNILLYLRGASVSAAGVSAKRPLPCMNSYCYDDTDSRSQMSVNWLEARKTEKASSSSTFGEGGKRPIDLVTLTDDQKELPELWRVWMVDHEL